MEGYDPYGGERDFYGALGDEDARRWDLDYALKKQGLDQQYSIAKLNAKTASERNAIDSWYNKAQIKLAQDRLAFDRESFEKTFGLNQAKLGYDVLGTAAQMRGADDYFQASNFMRGVANDPNSATFLSALRNNVRMPDFNAPSGSPDAFTLGSLTAKLGTPVAAGGQAAPATSGAAPQDASAAYLAQIHALGAQGAHKLGAGALEQLSLDELGLLKSGLEAPDADGKAFNWNDFLKQYAGSRIGQGLSGSNYAAA